MHQICDTLQKLSSTISFPDYQKVNVLIVQDRDYRAPEVLQYEQDLLALLAKQAQLNITFEVLPNIIVRLSTS